MRRIVFDDAFDGGVFRGPVGATAGSSFVGPLGALGVLEASLGLGRRPIGAGVRVGEALRGLSEVPGFWSKSLSVDGLATARELLRWADTLRLEGWSGDGAGRLGELGRALAGVSMGPAERLLAIRERLPLLGDVRFQLEHFVESAWWPRLWRDVLAGVGAAKRLEFPSAAANGALLASRERDFVPASGDATLQLIRPHGPVVAAECVAAALAAEPDVPTVIIGADPILDAALRRHGLPTTGASQTSHDNVLGEVLPLLMELVLAPADPNRAFELLSIDRGPIRPKVARALRHALEQWPAIGSPAWHDELAHVLPRLEGDDERAKVKERLAAIFQGDVRHARAVPTKRLLERVAWLQQWLHGHLSVLEEHEQGPWTAVVSQVALFRNLVDRAAVETLTMTQVRRMLEEAHAGMASGSAFPAQAGVSALSNPGGVVAPVERIVWWNYVRSSAPSPRVPMLTEAELSALATRGVRLPSISELARRRAVAWRRPFLMASRSLWLVSPRHELNGDEATPHPTWDELVARLGDSRDAARLTHEQPLTTRRLKTAKQTLLPTPRPVLEWSADVTLQRREQESPSSVEAMLGCSLSWALNYSARLRGGATATLSSTEQTLGTLAHYVLLERTLVQPHASEAAAADFALETLEREGPTLSAPLFLPGADAERGLVRQVLANSARVLFRLLAQGWVVDATEQELIGEGFGTKLGGTPDLILKRGERYAVIDLKWSGERYRRSALEAGTALQLATYAELVRQRGAREVVVAYFILTSQAMISTEVSLTGGTPLTSNWTASETFSLLSKTHSQAWALASRAHLSAPGVVDARHVPDTALDDETGALSVQPPCRFCDFDGICGRRYGVLEVVDAED